MRADVWAPFAQRVHCRTGGEDVPMTRGETYSDASPAMAIDTIIVVQLQLSMVAKTRPR